MNTSPRFSLDLNDLKKVVTGLFVAIGGCLIVYIPQALQGIHPVINLGGSNLDLSPILVIVAGSLVNIIRKWVTDHSA